MELSKKRMKSGFTDTHNDTVYGAALGSSKKISSLYVISFLILATLVVGFIWHDLRADYRDTLSYWNVQLSGSADEQVRVSALWLRERRTDTIAVAQNPWAVRLLSGRESRGKAAEVRQKLEQAIAHLATVNGFLGGAVGDRTCRITAQTGLRPEMAQGVMEACQLVQQEGEYRIDAFGMGQGHVWLTLSAPVVAEGAASPSGQIIRRLVGSAVMVAENWQDFVPFFGPESVSARTSETFITLIVWRKGGEALIYSPRLRARGAPSFFQRPLAGPTFESRVARDGDVAFGEFVDYRGVRVLGAARRITPDGDSLACKVDWEGALSDYQRHRMLDGLVGTLTLLLLGTVMVAQHRHAAARDFAERAKQQAALRESDHRYRVLFESAGDGIFLMQGDHFVDCNQKALELFGCGREQLLANMPSAFSSPQPPNGRYSREETLEKIRLAQEGETLHFEWQPRRCDGTPFEAEVTLSRLDIRGVAHLLALVRDVTEQKHAEDALRESEERFRATFENAGIGMALVDLQGHPLKTNPALREMLGYSEEELSRMAFTEFTHAEDRELDWRLYRELTAGKRDKYEIEKRYLKKDGGVVWGQLIVSMVKDRRGLPVYAVGMVQDITERKRAEEDLVMLKRSIDVHYDGAYWTDTDHRFIYVNDAACKALGYEREELIGKTLLDVNPKASLEGLNGVWQSLRSQGFFSTESVHRRKDGSEFPVEIVVTYVQSGGKEFSCGFARDITERRRAEEERQRSFDQLRALAARLQSIREEERKRVARDIHDQLGQALTAIKIDLSSLVRELPAGEKQPAKRTASILQLVDESIQSVRRISTELRPGILDDLGLVAAIEWAGEEFESRTGTPCRLDLPPENIEVDAERATAIFRIFQETLTNVARHADASQVDVRMACEGGDLTLEVYDNGKGINGDQLSNRASFGILGMRERAMLLGGELTISSPPGKGTTVRVRIPEVHPI